MKSIITAAIIAMATSAQAQEDPCPAFGGLAETMMIARQSGLPMSQMMELAGEEDIFRRMVIDAYDRPRYGTEEIQRLEIQDFRNEIEMDCYRSTGGG